MEEDAKPAADAVVDKEKGGDTAMADAPQVRPLAGLIRFQFWCCLWVQAPLPLMCVGNNSPSTSIWDMPASLRLRSLSRPDAHCW